MRYVFHQFFSRVVVGCVRRLAELRFAILAVSIATSALPGCLERPICGDCMPGTSNVFVKKVPVNNVTKIDLLFVIDNSASMADKQAVMKQAVPAMLSRLVTPNCVEEDKAGNIIRTEPGHRAGGLVTCGPGLSVEFQPISDINVGVITSSLGSHGFLGTASCDEPGKANPQMNDRARLIPLVRLDDANVAGQPPFLQWRGGQEDATALGATFGNYVAAAGESGCGFEATHEAWYRFLVDPEPPASMSIGENERAARGPVDEEILAQRRQFLRADSLVAIVVLTDENDCSAMDGGSYYDFAEYGYLSAFIGDRQGANYVRRLNTEPTDICATDPNNRCCQTCLDKPNPGCESHFEKCPLSTEAPLLKPEQDQGNVRCFENQRRFGFDLLYPVSRYIDGLSQAEVRGANGQLLRNALVADRDRQLIFFAGITGVPWQDLATSDTLHNPNELKYLTAKQLREPVEIDGVEQSYNYWDLILGSPGKHAESVGCREKANGDGTFKDPACGAKPVLPRDPFMVESIEPRTTRVDIISKTNERAGASLTEGPAWNAVNGHEYNTAWGDFPKSDLQYACIFPLGPFGGQKTQEECDGGLGSCDCETDDLGFDKPLCKRGGGASPGEGQFWGKAYPSTRTLEILKGFGENSIVASICPKVTDPSNADYYGYSPAVSAIIDRLKDQLGGQCLPRGLAGDEETGEVPCVVVEARIASESNADGASRLDCSLNGRFAATEKVRKAVLDELERSGSCYSLSTPAEERRGPVSCSQYEMCSIRQLSKQTEEGRYCLDQAGADSASPGGAGFCYIDEHQGNPQLLSECPVNEKRKLRFVHPQNVPTPQNGTVLFYACIGEATTGR